MKGGCSFYRKKKVFPANLRIDSEFPTARDNIELVRIDKDSVSLAARPLQSWQKRFFIENGIETECREIGFCWLKILYDLKKIELSHDCPNAIFINFGSPD